MGIKEEELNAGRMILLLFFLLSIFFKTLFRINLLTHIFKIKQNMYMILLIIKKEEKMLYYFSN